MTEIKQIDREAAVSLFLDVLSPVASYAEWGYPSDHEKATLEITEILARHRQRGHDEAVQKIVEWLRKTGDDAVIAACYRVAADAIERMDRHND